jgi:predicted transcriptional regulator
MLTDKDKKKILSMLKQYKRQVDIAKEVGVTVSSVQHFVKSHKSISKYQYDNNYFNVDLYFKTVATI